MNLAPIIKWSGSKRSQAEAIVARMPREIDTYYEPFCGGCSVLYRLLHTPSIKAKRYVASDINADLIALWTMVKHCPNELIEGYSRMWEEFNVDPYADERLYQWCTTELYSHRKSYFEEVRERYNKTHSPIDFFFIMRTTTNGMPRYNDEGKFNNSCHFSRPGMRPLELAKICRNWSAILKTKDVQFLHRSFEDVVSDDNSLIYLDPPYMSVERHQMYFGGIDKEKFFSWLRNLKGKWILSFDGKRGEEDYTYSVPSDLYVSHEYLVSGNSSFERYLGHGKTETVYESLYMNYKPDIEQEEVRQGELFNV